VAGAARGAGGDVIGSVRGTVVERTLAGEVLVEVGGVGYRVNVPVRAVPMLEPGAPAFLFTHLHVREDAMVLYGFPTRDERDAFEALIGATGVGPKLALAFLSVHTPAALRRALAEDDLDALVLVPGVGKRTAQRLIVELKARFEVPDLDLSIPGGNGASARAEVRDALVGLGYSADEVRAALGTLAEDGTVEDLLRDALRVLAGAR
jgi:holliday junction DNA helicase RuvA